MHKTLTTAICALLGGALFPTLETNARPPVPGPGGVVMAVEEFLSRQDAGEDLAPLVVDERHDLEFTVEDGAIAQVDDDARAVAAFHDVAWDGKPFSGSDAATFGKVSAKLVSSTEKAQRVLRTRIDRVRANCQSEHCSTAIVEFTRVYTVGGGKEMHVPMRATALMRYEEAPGVKGVHFRLFHWHASPAKR